MTTDQTKNKPCHWSNKTILIVEDDYINYYYLEALLEKTDAKIIHADEAEEALKIIRKQKDINLIIMDIRLKKMSGLQAASIIKTIHPSIPIIAYTAYTEEYSRALALEAGCDDFMVKPVRKDTAYEVLAKWLGK
jgi:two-component system, cell cycle response regulator DivK